MPELHPKLADVLEPHFARPAVVHEVQELGDGRLRRVRFSGPALRGLSFSPGQEIEFRVGPRAFRHYTPMHYEPTGILDVLFYLHDRGPGSTWAEQLRPGDAVGVLGPGGRYRLGKTEVHVFLGDETTVGLFHALSAHQELRIFGAIEFESRELASAAAPFVEPSVERLVRWDERGDALAEWIETVDPRPRGLTTSFYLAGHAQTIARLRTLLRGRGWPRRVLRSRPYWCDGKRGL